MLNQIKKSRENQAKIPLYKSLTSMRSLAVSIQSYNLFYGIKQASFFYILFEYLIPNDYLRVIPSLFFGYFVAKAMLNIAVNIPEKKEWVIVSIAVFDFLMLCVILDIMHKSDWIEIINLLIFCGFVTYVGYWLNQVFVLKVKEKELEEKSEKEQVYLHKIAGSEQKAELLNIEIADSEQKAELLNIEIADSEQKAELLNIEIADSEQKAELLNIEIADSEQKAELLNIEIADSEQKAKLLNIEIADLKEVVSHKNLSPVIKSTGIQMDLINAINTICPHCKVEFNNKKARDGHKGTCKMKPENIKKI
ncbi:hypothetical protein G1K46_09370 [Tenacibaculum finnmarkense]|uniref:hypothetical protein n=1 Tax=Tenacibaculum finnmarkense TaxID=2781243 RepID=UPI001EFB36F6|nr:hypothetical protein [Tenacibaculum finnmarkense]MCG8762939.1 hypothetical protein [Tenacibaculum finnmarkense]MCG8788432.1 hypothetical protein [Tenacibaculum finnmarkense]